MRNLGTYSYQFFIFPSALLLTQQPKSIVGQFEAYHHRTQTVQSSMRQSTVCGSVQGATKTCVTYVSIRFTVILYVITKYNIDCCPRCFSQMNCRLNEGSPLGKKMRIQTDSGRRGVAGLKSRSCWIVAVDIKHYKGT